MSDLMLYNSFCGSYEDYMKQLSTQTVTAIAADQINEHIDRASIEIQRGLVLNTKAVLANTQATVQVGRTLIASTELLNSTMETGFANISNELGNMSAAFSAGLSGVADAIERMSDKICSKLDEIHDIVNNPLLTASRELYRRAASNYKKKFYEEALEDILGAVEKNKTDYISWFLAGQLYLFGVGEFSNVINVPKAEEAFLNVVKYVSPDVGRTEEATKLAAEAYYYLAYARFILSNENKIAQNTEDSKKFLESSMQASSKAFSLSKGMYEALYNSARCNVLLGNTTDALKMIEECINGDECYIFKFLGNKEFEIIYNQIITVIEKLRQELILESERKINQINAFSKNSNLKFSSKYSDIRHGIKKYTDENFTLDISYLELRTVKKELESFLLFLRNEQSNADKSAAIFKNQYEIDLILVNLLKEFVSGGIDYALKRLCYLSGGDCVKHILYDAFVCEDLNNKLIFGNLVLHHDFTKEEIKAIKGHKLYIKAFNNNCQRETYLIHANELIKYLREKYNPDTEIINIVNEIDNMIASATTEAQNRYNKEKKQAKVLNSIYILIIAAIIIAVIKCVL